LPPADELFRLMVVACVKLVGWPPGVFADCKVIAEEQLLIWTLKAAFEKRRPVTASVCAVEVRPVAATVITGLPMTASL
jgi:hypothetical protein